MSVVRSVAPRLARLATIAVVRRPAAWRLFRRPLRVVFDALAPEWDTLARREALEPLEAALERVDGSPLRILEVGTGTGRGALLLARRFPAAEVTGIDLSQAMIARARAALPPDAAARARFAVADASALPFPAASFDLVVLVNMIPFFDELARVVAPGGALVVSFSRGAATPIYVPPERVRAELAARGFDQIAEIRAGAGIAVLAYARDAG